MDNVKTEDYRVLLPPPRTIGTEAPLRWLKLGWQDFKKIPVLSTSYGVVMLLITLIIAWVAFHANNLVVVFALLGGFFFIGPALGIGLYLMSRQLANDKTPTLKRCVQEARKNLSNTLVLSLVFLIIFLVWARAASMVHIFFPSSGGASAADLAVFLSVGSAIGAMFAAIVFCAGAFSIPMMMDRDIDAVTAVLTSISAVLRNKKAMLIWGAIIGASVLVGVLLGLIGLVVTLPVIGHATWHAYQEVIDIQAWDLSATEQA